MITDTLRAVVALNRTSSSKMVKLAQRAIRNPSSLTHKEVQSLGASVLSQADPS